MSIMPWFLNLKLTYGPLLRASTRFVNFLTKKDQFEVFYFVMIRILERIEIQSVTLFGKTL